MTTVRQLEKRVAALELRIMQMQQPEINTRPVTVGEVIADIEAGIIQKPSSRVRQLFYWRCAKNDYLHTVGTVLERNFGKKSQAELEEIKEHYKEEGRL